MGRMDGRGAAGLMALACLFSGCATAMVPHPPSRMSSGGTPMGIFAVPVKVPSLDVGAVRGATIAVAIHPRSAAFGSKAVSQGVAGNVTWYEIDLIQNQSTVAAATGDNYAGLTGGAIVACMFLDGPASGTPSGAQADGGTAGRVQFTNVPPFANGYRVRVMATEDSGGTAGPISGPQILNKPDNFFTSHDNWAISENKATVSNGSSTVTYTSDPGGGTSMLDVNVPLRDGVHDTLGADFVVNNGNSTFPAIGGGNGNL